MKKKLLVVSILAVFTLVAISLASAINANAVKPVKRKDSSLFGIRTRRAIGDRLKDLKESIKARFIGERLFFLPFQWIRNIRNKIHPLYSCTDCSDLSCEFTRCDDCTEDDYYYCTGSKTCDSPTEP